MAFWAAPREEVGGLAYAPQIEIRSKDNAELRNGSFFWSATLRELDTLPPDRPVELRPERQWNAAELEIRTGEMRYAVNGQLLLRAELQELAKRPEALPALRRRSGRVGFQSHTGAVRFRKIYIKELPPVKDDNAKQDSPSGSVVTQPREGLNGSRQKNAEQTTALMMQKLAAKLLKHVQVFSDEYAQISGRGSAYIERFREFRPRLERLATMIQGGGSPYEEIGALVLHMKNTNCYINMMANWVPPGFEGRAEKAWQDYAPAVHDLERAMAFSGDRTGSNAQATDPFQVGSVWTAEGGDGPGRLLLVLERAGERFKARFASPDETRRFSRSAGLSKGIRSYGSAETSWQKSRSNRLIIME